MFLVEFLFNLFSFISFVPNMKFPKPLKKSEEKELLEAYKLEGDEQARATLIERNLRLVANVAKKYVDRNREMNDLISIGTIGLIKGVQTFNIEKGSKLSTYVSRCIENEILMSIRAKKKERNEVSMDDTIGTDKEGNELTLMDVIHCDQREVSEKVELNIDIIKLYKQIDNKLSPLEKKVIVARFGLYNQKRKTQREVASGLEISRSYVSRIEKKAIDKLKNCI